MIQLSHDGFARVSVVRKIEVVHYSKRCAWCGARPKEIKNNPYGNCKLYRYGQERDDKPGERNVMWDKAVYCSIRCRNSHAY